MIFKGSLSSTLVSFTLKSAATITFVFNEDYSKRVKIDGEKYTVSDGILQISLSAGEHEITKADVANLYYISIAFSSSIEEQEMENTLLLYPNPTNGVLNLDCTSNINSIEIYSLSGIMLKTYRSSVQSINISSLRQGSYILKIATEQGTCCKIIHKN